MRIPAIKSELILARERLEELRDYPPGWDGAGGPAIQDAAIRAAETFLETLMRPRIVAVPGGGVQIEIGDAMEIEFLPDGSCEALIEFSDGQITAGPIGNSPRKR